jgi:hypothetical protein
MSVGDFVGTSKVQPGIPNYVAPSNEMLMKKPSMGKFLKCKNTSWAEAMIQKKKWVPGPQYQKIQNWNTLIPKNSGKFKTQQRMTVAGEIYHRAKKKETSSPSVHDYNPMSWKNKAGIGRTVGFYKQKD